MNKKLRGGAHLARLFPVAVLGVLAVPASAQDADATESGSTSAAELEEVVVIGGRQRSVNTDVVQARIEEEVVADFLGIEQIGRVGDSTVSAALRRLPGVTLVQGKYIYVRGLGERYSSTTLNGAYVPSPDLTRNVLPLDIFPTVILDSLAVSKGFAPDLPASFGGGGVDIRTTALPEDPFIQLQIGSGFNTDSSGSGLSYPGGDDDFLGTDDGTRALSDDLLAGIYRFKGDLSPASILSVLNYDGSSHTIEEAEQVNRELATYLNRDIDISDKSLSPDVNLSASGGNTWYFGSGQEWGFGLLGLVDYGNQWRNRNRSQHGATAATKDIVVSDTERTVHQVDLTTALTTGIKWFEDHRVEAMYLYLRNTEDEAAISLSNNTNTTPDSGLRLRNYLTRFEERELTVQQLRGEHVLGPESLDVLGNWVNLNALEGLKVTWYVSDSKAQTDIPNETSVSAIDTIDQATGDVTTTIRATSSAGDFRFTDLVDELDSTGWELELPIDFTDLSGIKLGVGQDTYQKGRRYLQTQFGLGTTAGGTEAIRTGMPSVVFSDANLMESDYGFLINLGGLGTESYLAAERVTATFAKFDLKLWETWRIFAGARYEDFSQLSIPVNQYDFTPGKLPVDPEDLPDYVTSSDDVYPAVALTYMRPGFWGEEFQLRFNYSETATRADLREVADAVYIDPLTEIRIQGNPDLVPSELSNYDIRAEWFFENRDSLAVTLFYKDISNPIETVEGAGSEDNVLLSFINAESAEVQGIEFEGLMSLGRLSGLLGSWTDSFFVAGNVTLSDSEITIGAGSGFNATNNTRPLSQSSEYSVNLQLGYDSLNGQHSASLAFNTFGERVFYAGRGGAPDAYEQPFESLDLTYSWFPTEIFTLRFRAQNILNDKQEIERGGITTLTQEIGTSYSLTARLRF